MIPIEWLINFIRELIANGEDQPAGAIMAAILIYLHDTEAAGNSIDINTLYINRKDLN